MIRQDTRNIAYMSVTSVLLEDRLRFPKNHRIIGAEWHPELQAIRLLIEGPDLPEHKEGHGVETVTPTITITTSRGKEETIWDWNT